MNKLYCTALLTATLAVFNQSRAQQIPSGNGFNCSQHIETNQLFKEHPEMEADYNEQQKIRDEIARKFYENRNNKDEKTYIIPVVFHIVHQGGVENVSDAQIKNAVDVLNQEFGKTNPAANNIDPFFVGRAADCNIEFRLATIDPTGNCTNGINRYFDTRTVGADDQVKAGRQWPTNKYLNIYTCASIGSGAAGYAYYPANGNEARDGILIIHSYIGNIGTGTPGRQSALTHEVGHYLNLAHTWGNSNNPGEAGNCGTDDGVADTPLCAGSRECNLNNNTCDDGTANDEKDNIQNFMEYAYCYAMYTEGQKARARAALNSSAAGRNNLWTDANLAETGANYTTPPNNLCKADFGVNTNKPVCAGNTVTFYDYSFNGVTKWNWSFPGGSPSSSTAQNPTVTYSTPGSYDVTLEVSNDVQSVSTTKTQVVNVISNNTLGSPYAQNFESISSLLTPDFEVENPNGDVTWRSFSSAGFGSSSSAYVKARSISGSGKVDNLITKTMDLSNLSKPHIRFDYAYARKSTSSTDELNIYVSTDCGVTWVKRKVLKGSVLRTSALDVPVGDFVPAGDSEWKETDVNIESFAKPGARIKFEWITNGGNNVYIDNINIYDLATVGIDDLNSRSLQLSVYPNPSSDEATISFDLVQKSTISLDLINVVGKKCMSLISESIQEPGEHRLTFRNGDLPAGVYFIKMKANNQNFSQKIIIQ